MVILICLALLVGSVSLIYPYGRDQATYSYVGRAVLAGKVPYKDAWDVKPPAIFYLYALADTILGKSQTSVRIFDMIWQAATAAIIALVGLTILGNRNLGFLCGALYILSYYVVNYWNTAQPEGFSTLLLASAVFILLRRKQRSRSFAFFSAGLLIACSSLLKYPLGLMIALPILLSFRQEGLKMATALPALAAGFLMPYLVTVLYFFSRSALGDLIYSQFIYGYHHVTSGLQNDGALVSLTGSIIDMSKILFASEYAIIFLLSVPAVILVLRKRKREELAVLFWFCIGLVHVLSQGKLFRYHFLPLLAPMSLMAVICLKCLSRQLKSRTSRALTLLIVLLSISILRLPFRAYRTSFTNLFGMASGKIDQMEYFERLSPRGRKTNFCLPYDIDVADYLRSNTDSTDYVFIWGFEPLIYLESARSCPTRFIYNVPLYCKWAREDFRDELIGSLSTTRPEIIIVTENDSLPAVSGLHIDSRQALGRFPDLKQYLEVNYAPEKKIGHFTLYTLVHN